MGRIESVCSIIFNYDNRMWCWLWTVLSFNCSPTGPPPTHITILYDINTVRKKKKVNGPKGAKYFFPVERGKFFLASLYYGQSSPLWSSTRYPKNTAKQIVCFPKYHYSSTPISIRFWQKDLSHCYTGKNYLQLPGRFFFWPLYLLFCKCNHAVTLCFVDPSQC